MRPVWLWAGIGLLTVSCSGELAAATPETFPRLEAGRWHEVPNSRLRDAASSNVRGGSLRGITAWSGAAYDSRRHRMLVWGGGHSNYAGNEVYAFEVVESRWLALSRPSEPDKERTPLYADGQPRSRHTYNYIEYVPTIDRLISFGGSGPFPRGGGEFTRDLSEFEAERGQWVTGKRAPVPTPEGRAGSMIGAHARWDPSSRTVIFVPSTKGSIMRYDPQSDTWRVGERTNHVRAHSTAAIDPERREFLLIGASRGKPPQFKRWNIDKHGVEEDLTARSTGAKEAESAYGPGFDYHPPSGCMVAWTGGPDLYLLHPGTLYWQRLTPNAGSVAPPLEHNKTGTYGRFRYDSGLDLFVLVNGVDENVFLYRPRIEKDRCRRR